MASTGTEIIALQKGECLVFSQYLGSSAANQPPNGFMGGLVESSKPIVINSGSWCGSPVTASDKDSGIDQIVPLENVGKEYILSRGNGSASLERPLIVAHFKNTQIFINGSASAVATLVTLTVTDSMGCIATDKLILRVQPNVYAPNVIAPQ